MKNIMSNGLCLALILCASLVALKAQADRDSSRDQFRHPAETIEFFDLTPEMDVVEITPGGGWYTEILADYVTGTLFVPRFWPIMLQGHYLRPILTLSQRVSTIATHGSALKRK